MDGKQMAVINEWEKSTSFYKMWPAEADIRDGAKKCSNAYFIGIFACCREIFNPNRHRDLISGTEIQANVDFATRAREDELKAQATAEQAKTDAEEIRALKKHIEELKAESKLQKNIEQSRRKKTGLNTLKVRLGSAVNAFLGKFILINIFK